MTTYFHSSLPLVALFLAFSVFLSGCTAEDRSRQALDAQGFTQIRMTGYSMFSCSDEDTFSTGFTATNPNGTTVSGTVCCGWIKDCTIRW